MAGYLKIMRTDLATGTDGRTMEDYQVSYVAGEHAFVRMFDFYGLETFLTNDLGLTPSHANEVVNTARLQGTATVPGVNISENDAAVFGLTRSPSDE